MMGNIIALDRFVKKPDEYFNQEHESIDAKAAKLYRIVTMSPRQRELFLHSNFNNPKMAVHEMLRELLRIYSDIEEY